MMVASRISSRKSMIRPTKKSMKPRNCGMNTDLSMIWLLTASRVTEPLCGLARTMMVTFSQTLSLRDTDLSD